MSSKYIPRHFWIARPNSTFGFWQSNITDSNPHIEPWEDFAKSLHVIEFKAFKYLQEENTKLVKELEEYKKIPIIEKYDKITGKNSVWLRQEDVSIELKKLEYKLQLVTDTLTALYNDHKASFGIHEDDILIDSSSLGQAKLVLSKINEDK